MNNSHESAPQPDPSTNNTPAYIEALRAAYKARRQHAEPSSPQSPHVIERRKVFGLIAVGTVGITATLLGLGLKIGSDNVAPVEEADISSYPDVGAPSSPKTIYDSNSTQEPQSPYGIPPGISVNAGITVFTQKPASIEYVQTEQQRK